MSDMDYVGWLSRLVLDNADSPNFAFGPLDQKRLASAVLSMLPVVKAAEAWSDADRAMEHGDDPMSGERFRVAWDRLNDALDTWRKASNP